MRQANAPAARPAAKMSSGTLARKCDCGNHAAGGACPACAEERRKRQVSRYAERGARLDHASAAAVPSIVDDAVQAPGQRLPADVRAFMEPRFGSDFSDVRVHTDATSAHAAHAVAARAYTMSSHVVFGAGQYAPGTDTGRRLLAHELTHVVQQRQGGAAAPAADRRVSDPSDAAEREADAAAERVTSPAVGASTPITQAGAGVQRLPEALTGITTGFAAVGAFGAGILIGTLAGAFDRDIYSTEELIAYLDGLARRRQHEGHRNSDNKARDVVRHWLAGDPKIVVSRGHAGAQGALTPVDLKRLLIAEMLDGATTGPDEDAILEILERSTAAEILEIVDPAKGVSVNKLLEDLDGDNNARLRALFDARFPQGAAVRAQQDAGCRGTEAVMISVALRAAEARLDHAILVLIAPSAPDVKPALDCRFRGASLSQIIGIQATFERIRALLPSRQFFCLHGNDKLVRGNDTVTCGDGQEASSFINGIPDIALCPKFFASDPEAQAVTVIHEVAHAAGVTEDIQTRPPCGWDLALALQEPDSFALLASELFAARAAARAVGAPAPVPAPVPAPAGGGGKP